MPSRKSHFGEISKSVKFGTIGVVLVIIGIIIYFMTKKSTGSKTTEGSINYKYGKIDINDKIYKGPTPKGPWTEVKTEFKLTRIFRTPTGYLAIRVDDNDNNIYKTNNTMDNVYQLNNTDISQPGWVKHPTLPSTNNYFQIMMTESGQLAGIYTIGKGDSQNECMFYDTPETPVSGSKLICIQSKQVFQLSDKSIGYIDSLGHISINQKQTSFDTNYRNYVPVPGTFNWVLPMSDGSVYLIGSDNNLYYSETGFISLDDGETFEIPEITQVDNTRDYKYLF